MVVPWCFWVFCFVYLFVFVLFICLFLFCFLYLRKRLSRLIVCQIHYFDNKRHSLHLNIFYLFLRNRTLLFGYSPGTKNKYLQFNTDYYCCIVMTVLYLYITYEKILRNEFTQGDKINILKSGITYFFYLVRASLLSAIKHVQFFI